MGYASGLAQFFLVFFPTGYRRTLFIFLDFCRRRGLDEDPDDNTKMQEVDEMNAHEEQK